MKVSSASVTCVTVTLKGVCGKERGTWGILDVYSKKLMLRGGSIYLTYTFVIVKESRTVWFAA